MARRTGVLDVRTSSPSERHAQAIAKFDALESGQAFVLVSDHEPRGLLGELQATRPRAFEWNVIGVGPDGFRVEIERRADDPRDVSEFLGRDHDRLDAILEEAKKHATGGDFKHARACFGEFVAGLIHHIQMEENVLFPMFEKVTGFTAGPTVVMRAEHRTIGQLLEQAETALGADDRQSFLNAAAELVSVLGRHNQKEESVLYPMTDRSLPGDPEREELVRALQASSCEGPCGCCSSAPESRASGRRLGVVRG